MSIRPTNFNSCSWSWTVVCGADDTARDRFAYEFALRHGGHVVDTGDLLTGVRALTSAQTHPELFYGDAEDHRGFLPSEGVGPSPREPLPGTPAELADARMRAADALDPAVHKLIGKQPRVTDAEGWGPHPIFSGRYALPTQGHDFAIIVTVTPEQVMENLRAHDPWDDALGQRVETAMLVQEELRRRAAVHREGHCYVYEAPFGSEHGSVEALYRTMDDAWDAATALGGMW